MRVSFIFFFNYGIKLSSQDTIREPWPSSLIPDQVEAETAEYVGDFANTLRVILFQDRSV